jgi:hypothetical protein
MYIHGYPPVFVGVYPVRTETNKAVLAEIAQETGFDVIGVVQRLLDRNRRMMPARFGKKTDSMIEQRMHEEYVIGLLKPA